MAINVKGTWLCMKHEIPEILRRGGGVIVNCGSTASVRGGAGVPAPITRASTLS
jgi:NAD(P)-dependent dehydrogenase (short-subunit alcohol dehydrogenase family)